MCTVIQKAIYLFIFPFPMVIESIELDIILSLVKAIETAVTMTPFFIYLFIIIFFKDWYIMTCLLPFNAKF